MTWSAAAVIILVGLLTAHLYERTGKLLLCIAFHSACSAFIMSAPLVGHLLGLHP